RGEQAVSCQQLLRSCEDAAVGNRRDGELDVAAHGMAPFVLRAVGDLAQVGRIESVQDREPRISNRPHDAVLLSVGRDYRGGAGEWKADLGSSDRRIRKVPAD